MVQYTCIVPNVYVHKAGIAVQLLLAVKCYILVSFSTSMYIIGEHEGFILYNIKWIPTRRYFIA